MQPVTPPAILPAQPAARARRRRMKFWRRVTISLPIPIVAELENRYGPMLSTTNSGQNWTLGTLAISRGVFNFLSMPAEQAAAIEAQYSLWFDGLWMVMREAYDLAGNQDDADAAAKAAAATASFFNGQLSAYCGQDIETNILARRIRQIAERLQNFPDSIAIANAILEDLVVQQHQPPRLRLVGGAE